MTQEKPFQEGFQNPHTGESVFGEDASLELGDADEGADEADGITSGTMEIAREKLKEYFVPEKYHGEIIDLIDEMMMGKLGKELQEEIGFDGQLKAAIMRVEVKYGVSFDIEYDEDE